MTGASSDFQASKRRLILNDPNARSVLAQILAFVIAVSVIYSIVHNASENLQRANIASGFGFLNARAGFELGQTLITYSSDSTFGRALLAGFLNTLLVAIAGIIAATIIGFSVGLGRLSNNWLVAKLCTVYIELFRNVPPLLVLFFWYSGVLQILPQARDSLRLPLGIFLNNRGLAFPKPIFEMASLTILIALIIGVSASITITHWARRRQAATGKQFHTILLSAALILCLPTCAFVLGGMSITFDFPVAGKFNLTGGSIVGPEFMSLFLTLSFYTAAFIAEIVRAGIRGVPRGQSEAAASLGLRPSVVTRLVVVPQALRIIIPPLTSQYLNLTKNSSLAVAVGFADLVAVGGTTLNLTGQAIEVISIWIMVYLGLSILTSLLMNWVNGKMALAER